MLLILVVRFDEMRWMNGYWDLNWNEGSCEIVSGDACEGSVEIGYGRIGWRDIEGQNRRLKGFEWRDWMILHVVYLVMLVVSC